MPRLPPMTLPLPLSYTLKRNIVLPQAWSWFFVLGVLGFFGILVPLNLSTQGYQTVSIYATDYNTPNRKWYNTFTPGYPKPGTACQSHLFATGDTTATGHGLFLWSLGTPETTATSPKKLKDGSLNNKNGDDWLVTEYKGNTTGWCDVWEVLLTVDTNAWSASLGAMFLCYDISGITGSAKVLAGFPDASVKGDANTLLDSDMQLWLSAAASDVLNAVNLTQSLTTAPNSQVSRLSIFAYPDTCPEQILVNRDRFLTEAQDWSDINTWCEPEDVNAPPRLGLDWEEAYSLPNQAPSSDLIDLLNNSVSNAMQAMVAAVRYDLGNLQPNNFISNPSIFNETFFPPVPPVYNTTYTQGQFYNSFSGGKNGTYYDAAAYKHEKSQFTTTYLCRQSEWKSAASAFVAVLVATVSLGGSAWGVAMLVLSFWAKRGKPDADCCEYHAALSTPEGSPTKLEMEQHVPQLEKV